MRIDINAWEALAIEKALDAAVAAGVQYEPMSLKRLREKLEAVK
jgi:hypothetical protein